jgi:hypothetical protein
VFTNCFDNLDGGVRVWSLESKTKQNRFIANSCGFELSKYVMKESVGSTQRMPRMMICCCVVDSSMWFVSTKSVTNWGGRGSRWRLGDESEMERFGEREEEKEEDG